MLSVDLCDLWYMLLDRIESEIAIKIGLLLRPVYFY